MAEDEVVVELPLPPRQVSPNARVYFRRQAEATKAYRRTACMLTIAAGGRNRRWTRARAQATFYWPNNLRRDIRNAEHSLKAAYDGMVDAGLIVDDRAEVLRHDETTFDVDTRRPRVVIRVTQE